MLAIVTCDITDDGIQLEDATSSCLLIVPDAPWVVVLWVVLLFCFVAVMYILLAALNVYGSGEKAG